MRFSLSICKSRRYVALFSFAAILFAVAAEGQLVEVSAQKTVAQSNADVLLADVQQLRYDDLEADIADTPAGFDHDLFEGILANRANRLDESVRLLTPIVATTDIPRKLMALALGALADDQVKLFHYADASRLYDRLLGDYANQLSPAWRRDDQDDDATLKTILNAPPQTIAFNGPIDLPTHTDPLGSFVADLTLNGVTQGWILDTGANISTISESFAKRIGVIFSSRTAETLGGTGAENPLHRHNPRTPYRWRDAAQCGCAHPSRCQSHHPNQQTQDLRHPGDSRLSGLSVAWHHPLHARPPLPRRS